MRRFLTDAIRRASPVAMVVAVLLVSGCVAFEDNVQQGYSNNRDFGEKGTVTFTTADVRTVIERKRVKDSDTKQIVVCSEPSPDTAMAISLLSKLGVNTTNSAGGVVQDTIGVQLEHQTTQAISQLAGRSVAVQALRDGTYRACEAYANGAIDKEEYALILSQYGDVLSTLILAENGDKAGIASISGNYVAYSLPRLLHTIFVSCTEYGAVPDQNNINIANTKNQNTFLKKFCPDVADPNNFAKLLTALKQAMPEPFQAKAAETPQTATAAAASTGEWTITFSSGDSPTEEGDLELGKALKALLGGSEKITIVGHVDAVPPKKGVTNAQVAMSRAVKVYNFLLNHGIDAKRLDAKALPKGEPMKRVAIITVEKAAKSAAK